MDFFQVYEDDLTADIILTVKNLIICSLVKLKQSQDARKCRVQTEPTNYTPILQPLHLASEATPPACDITL